MLVAPTLMYACGNLANDEESYKIAAIMLQLATFSGIRSDGKGISFDLSLNAELLQGIYDWNQHHPKQPLIQIRRKPGVEYNAQKTAGSYFNLRAPEHKHLLDSTEKSADWY